MITCSTCKGQFLSYPEFTAHIGNLGCANEIIAAPALEHLPLRSLTEAAEASASLSALTSYQANVFLILNDGRAGKRFRDEVALELIARHSGSISEYERRRFAPLATARAIIEAEADADSVCEDIDLTLEGAIADTQRIDWLEEFIQTGHAEVAFEMEGGVHLTLSKVGDCEPNIYREQNSLRDAIDAAMKEVPNDA